MTQNLNCRMWWHPTFNIPQPATFPTKTSLSSHGRRLYYGLSYNLQDKTSRSPRANLLLLALRVSRQPVKKLEDVWHPWGVREKLHFPNPGLSSRSWALRTSIKREGKKSFTPIWTAAWRHCRARVNSLRTKKIDIYIYISVRILAKFHHYTKPRFSSQWHLHLSPLFSWPKPLSTSYLGTIPPEK